MPELLRGARRRRRARSGSPTAATTAPSSCSTTRPRSAPSPRLCRARKTAATWRSSPRRATSRTSPAGCSPPIGIDEDPVTGSAHAALVPYWAKRLGRERLHRAPGERAQRHPRLPARGRPRDPRRPLPHGDRGQLPALSDARLPRRIGLVGAIVLSFNGAVGGVDLRASGDAGGGFRQLSRR